MFQEQQARDQERMKAQQEKERKRRDAETSRMNAENDERQAKMDEIQDLADEMRTQLHELFKDVRYSFGLQQLQLKRDYRNQTSEITKTFNSAIGTAKAEYRACMDAAGDEPAEDACFDAAVKAKNAAKKVRETAKRALDRRMVEAQDTIRADVCTKAVDDVDNLVFDYTDRIELLLLEADMGGHGFDTGHLARFGPHEVWICYEEFQDRFDMGARHGFGGPGGPGGPPGGPGGPGPHGGGFQQQGPPPECEPTPDPATFRCKPPRECAGKVGTTPECTPPPECTPEGDAYLCRMQGGPQGQAPASRQEQPPPRSAEPPPPPAPTQEPTPQPTPAPIPDPTPQPAQESNTTATPANATGGA